MERNKNEQQVVMSIEVYQNLLGMADRNRYTTAKIERHVRKFNPYLQAPHQLLVRQMEERRSHLIRTARACVEQHHGKVLFAQVDMMGSKKGDDPVFCPVVVKRVLKDRRFVGVVKLHLADLDEPRYTRVSANTLDTQIPEDYIKGVAEYREYYVKANGPYDVRERVIAEQNVRLAANTGEMVPCGLLDRIDDDGKKIYKAHR